MTTLNITSTIEYDNITSLSSELIPYGVSGYFADDDAIHLWSNMDEAFLKQTLYTIVMCISSTYPHIPTESWLIFFSFGLTITGFYVLGLLALNGKPLYSMLLLIAPIIDVWILNHFLQEWIEQDAPVPGCGGEYAMPNTLAELIALISTLIITYPYFYNAKKDVIRGSIGAILLSYIILGQIYLNYANVFQCFIGAIIGTVLAIICQILFYLFVLFIHKQTRLSKLGSTIIKTLGYSGELTDHSSNLFKYYLPHQLIID